MLNSFLLAQSVKTSTMNSTQLTEWNKTQFAFFVELIKLTKKKVLVPYTTNDNVCVSKDIGYVLEQKAT